MPPGMLRLRMVLPALCVNRQMADIVATDRSAGNCTMSVQMPEPDRRGAGAPRADRRRAAHHRAGRGRDRDRARDAPYETDGLTAYRQLPMVVVLPETTEQVSQVLRYCHDEGHQGGAARRRHLALRRRAAARRRRAARHGQVQPHPRDRLRQPRRGGRAGRHQSRDHATRSRMRGFYYAPDPSSQIACTIGGNVAENSGGVHCLKYGMTTNNVLGCEMVLIDRRGAAPRRQASRRRRLRSARHHHRLGRPARRRHRGDGAHPEEAGDRARRAGRLPDVRGRRRMRRRASSAPASSRAAWR